MPFAFRQSLESQGLRYIRAAADSDPTQLQRIDSDIVPDDAPAIMLTYRLRNHPSFVPELCGACNRDPRKVAVEGDDQSVNSTGSQTTKVRTCLPARLPKMWSNAEAPCRHTGQVGDKSSRTRTSSFAALKSFLISTTFCARDLLQRRLARRSLAPTK